MIWLTYPGGLPFKEWQTYKKHSRICNLCLQEALETSEHRFYTCPSVVGVWDKVRRKTMGDFETQPCLVSLVPKDRLWSQIGGISHWGCTLSSLANHPTNGYRSLVRGDQIQLRLQVEKWMEKKSCIPQQMDLWRTLCETNNKIK